MQIANFKMKNQIGVKILTFKFCIFHFGMAEG